MTANYKLLLFDLDGTLLHTAPDVHRSINMALEKMNIPPLSYEKSIKAIGPGADRFIHTVLGPDYKHRLEEFTNTFRPIYRENCTIQTKPFPGIVELLKALNGFDLTIITNKSRETSISILDHLKLVNYFKLIVGPELVKNIKPFPDMVNYTLQYFQTSPENALVIGDTDNDILAAKASGVAVCAVSWGYAMSDVLLVHNPDFFIKEPGELLGIINVDKTERSTDSL